MDLLFKRYASPFLLLDNFILTSSCNDFIDDFCKIIIEEREHKTQWEYFLHKVFDQSWSDFVSGVKVSNEPEEIDLGATIIKSRDMLKNFTPEREV